MTASDEHEAFVEIGPRRKSDGRGAGYEYGFVPAMSRLISAHQRIGAAFAALYREVMFEPGRLSRRERELVAAVAASAQDCHY